MLPLHVTPLPPNRLGTTTAAPTLDQLVASSAGWLAVALNLGGQGLGYIYQRRWGAFWIGGVAAMGSAVLLGIGSAIAVNSLLPQTLPEGQEDRTGLIGVAAAAGAYAGVLAVGVGSAVEAGLAVNRSRRRLITPVNSDNG